MNRYEPYTILKFVGEGSFARVYKVRHKQTHKVLALKCIQKAGKSQAEIEKLMEEITILTRLSHPNIIRMMEWFDKETEICVVTEYAEKGELFKMERKLSELEIACIARQLVSALQFLWRKRVIHRDIKPQNILLTESDVIKICDFGFARALSLESTTATSIKGTPLYMAPELVQEKPYDHRVDLWSLGVILYELYYGKPPFYTNSIYKLVRMIVRDPVRWPPSRPISREFQHFMMALLHKKPLKRARIEDLHLHPFLSTEQRESERDKYGVSTTTLSTNGHPPNPRNHHNHRNHPNRHLKVPRTAPRRRTSTSKTAETKPPIISLKHAPNLNSTVNPQHKTYSDHYALRQINIQRQQTVPRRPRSRNRSGSDLGFNEKRRPSPIPMERLQSHSRSHSPSPSITKKDRILTATPSSRSGSKSGSRSRSKSEIQTVAASKEQNADRAPAHDVKAVSAEIVEQKEESHCGSPSASSSERKSKATSMRGSGGAGGHSASGWSAGSETTDRRSAGSMSTSPSPSASRESESGSDWASSRCSRSSHSVSSESVRSEHSETPSVAVDDEGDRRKKQTLHSVKQQVLEIVDSAKLDSTNWLKIDKLLAVLPQRWHSLQCGPHDVEFELNLFVKLSAALCTLPLSANSMLPDPEQTELNILSVINLCGRTVLNTAASAFDGDGDGDERKETEPQSVCRRFNAAMRSATKHLLARCDAIKLKATSIPALCAFVEMVVGRGGGRGLIRGSGPSKEWTLDFVDDIHSEIGLLMISQFVRFLKSTSTSPSLSLSADSGNTIAAVTASVIDSICHLLDHHPLSYRIPTPNLSTDHLDDDKALQSFSKSALSSTPLFAFWMEIERRICTLNEQRDGASTSTAIRHIIGSLSARPQRIRFVLYLTASCPVLRGEIEGDLTMKQQLIRSLCRHALCSKEQQLQFEGLLVLYLLKEPLSGFTDSVDCQMTDIRGALRRLTASHSVTTANLSRSVMVTNAPALGIEAESVWQSVLKFVRNEEGLDLDAVLFNDDHIESGAETESACVFSKNSFDFWCNALSTKMGLKLSAALCLSFLNILSHRIGAMVAEDDANRDRRDRAEKKRSSQRSLPFVSGKGLCRFLAVLQRTLKDIISSKGPLLKEFVRRQHLETLCLLGNPQFVLRFAASMPFHFDSLFLDLVECNDGALNVLLTMYRMLTSSSLGPALMMDFQRTAMSFGLIRSILNLVQIAPPRLLEAASNVLLLVVWKQPVLLKEFVTNHGLQIVSEWVLRRRRQHSDRIVVHCIQIVSCLVRKSSSALPAIESAGILALIPELISRDSGSADIREKTCNLVGNLCKHSVPGRFLTVIRSQRVLQSLCDCTASTESPTTRRFACYAIGNMAYQTTRGRPPTNAPPPDVHDLDMAPCIEPLAQRLLDRDYKTQENAAGAIGNLVSSPCPSVIAQIVKHDVVRLLLLAVRQSDKFCVVRNCLYSLSNVCHLEPIQTAIRSPRCEWRRTLKRCLDAHGTDPYVKKCAVKICRKMENANIRQMHSRHALSDRTPSRARRR